VVEVGLTPAELAVQSLDQQRFLVLLHLARRLLLPESGKPA
jgi:hypothetical protein